MDKEIDGLAERSRVETNPEDPVPEERRGLKLEIAGASSPWKNEAVVLPGQTPISISGVVSLPSDAKTLRLRSANAYGSERLDFEFGGLKHEEGVENGSHRFYGVELREGTESVRIKIGKESVSNSWSWGPLQWSINGRDWKDIPVSNLSIEGSFPNRCPNPGVPRSCLTSRARTSTAPRIPATRRGCCCLA